MDTNEVTNEQVQDTKELTEMVTLLAASHSPDIALTSLATAYSVLSAAAGLTEEVAVDNIKKTATIIYDAAKRVDKANLN